MQVTVEQLAALVQGIVHGDPDLVVGAARPIAEAEPGDITFVETERHLRLIAQCKAAVLVLPPSLVPRLAAFSGDQSFTLIETADPLLAFSTIVQHLIGQLLPYPPGVSGQASVHSSVQLGEGCTILPFAFIGEGTVLGKRCLLHPGVVVGRNCRIGDDVVLHPGAVLYDRSVLGDRVVIHANTVLGADGFGYREVSGQHVKVPQLGHVEIGDDVEIGACTTVDRGTFQPTRIGAGTKIDNLVMIAHNCNIGQHNLLVAQVGIAGSSSTGNYVVMAGQVGVADHTQIGDGAVIGARSGVHSVVPAGARMLGSPAWPEREARRILLSMPNLPALCKDVRLLKQKLGIKEDE